VLTLFYFAADHGQSGPLTFHCPGNEDMIAFLEDKKSIQVCRMSLYYHRYRTISSVTKLEFLFYSNQNSQYHFSKQNKQHET